MFASLYLGPLYNAKPATKDYYKHSGRAFINSSDDGGTVYFMTGSTRINVIYLIDCPPPSPPPLVY